MSSPPPRRKSPRRSSGLEVDTNNAAPSSSTTTINNATKTKTKLKIRVKRWHGVAKWTWGVGDDEDDVCIVCQSAFEGVAPGVKFPGDECPVVVSEREFVLMSFILQHTCTKTLISLNMK